MINPKSLANLHPRANGSKSEWSIGRFYAALKKVEKSKRLPLYEHAIIRAYKNDRVLVALLNKTLPDKLEHSGGIDHRIINIKLE